VTRGFHLGRILGVDVYLDWSLIIIFMLVTFSLGAGGLPQWHPDWSPATIWITAAAAAVLFLASVLIHEMSHALVGRMHGVDVPRITLFVFGGMAQMREEPQAWKAELWMAIAGPLTSLGLGALFLVLGSLVAGSAPVDVDDPEAMLRSLSPVATLFFWLGPINIVLAIFNLVPGFPLDGGRVLRALIWGWTGSIERATRMASNSGRFFAWLLIGTGVAMALGIQVPFFGRGVVGGLWLVLIGWFLNNAAVMSYRQLLIRESLNDVSVSRLMHTAVEHVAPRISVRSLVDDHLLKGDQRAFPVVEGDRLLGLVCMRDVYKLPRSEWDAHAVADIMTPKEKLVAISPSASGYEAINALSEAQVNQLPVIEEGVVTGMVRREDILRWLSVYGHDRLRPGAAS
jgi:Zn-dependent protease/CBS domain-containing protein